MLTRFRKRRVHELADIADIEGDVAMANWCSVEAILGAKPGTMLPDPEKMKDKDWARFVNTGAAAAISKRVVVLKSRFPSLDITLIAKSKPSLLLEEIDVLQRRAEQAALTLHTAQDAGKLIGIIPDLLNPQACASILGTLARFFPKKPSVETLEKDPDIVRRMEENDVALDPAFFVGVHDASGFELYAVQGIDQTAAKESLQDWQKYIRETVHGKKPSSTFHVPMGD